jgi:putative Mn2+ efflux pump MntP
MSFAPPVPALLFSAAGSGSVGLLTLIGIAVGLSADCFAVALGASLSAPGSSRWRGPRTALSFGAFQAAMPVIGWLAGRTVVNFIISYDHWVAFGLLAFVGGKMLWESVHGDEEHEGKGDVTRGLMLLTISLATSIDALAVGLSFAFLEVNIAAASLTIGVVAAVITGLAFLLGRKAGKMLGKRAETIGGLVLIGIGVRILVSHLL